jgi:hypothetical protein
MLPMMDEIWPIGQVDADIASIAVVDDAPMFIDHGDIVQKRAAMNKVAEAREDRAFARCVPVDYGGESSI